MLAKAIAAGSVLGIVAIAASAIGDASYPVKGVLWCSALVVIETTALLVVLRPSTYRQSWGRALLALLVCVVALWFSAQDTVGAPEYVFTHQKWLVTAAGGCAALAIGSLIVRLRKKRG